MPDPLRPVPARPSLVLPEKKGYPLFSKMVERAFDFGLGNVRYMGVKFGGFDGIVPQQVLHIADIGTVIGHAMATVRNPTDRHQMNRTVIFGQAVFANLRKIKGEAGQTHKNPTQFASQLVPIFIGILFCPTAQLHPGYFYPTI